MPEELVSAIAVAADHVLLLRQTVRQIYAQTRVLPEFEGRHNCASAVQENLAKEERTVSFS